MNASTFRCFSPRNSARPAIRPVARPSANSSSVAITSRTPRCAASGATMRSIDEVASTTRRPAAMRSRISRSTLGFTSPRTRSRNDSAREGLEVDPRHAPQERERVLPVPEA